MGASAIWSTLCSENGLPSSIGSDKGVGIVAEGDWLPEPAREVLEEGRAYRMMADSESTCLGVSGYGGFIQVGVSRCANPTRQLASLSR